MKATIRDPEVLRAVALADVVEYLRGSGWNELPQGSPGAAFWAKEGFPELLLPKHASVRDYALRVAEILTALEHAEERSQLEILRDISLVSADVVRLRLPTADERDGSIPIDEGVTLVEKARSIMAASASATVQPRRIIPTRRPPEATEYIKTLRLGQTERGSYVVTVISRVTPLLIPGRNLDMIEEPFPRRVTTTLARSLKATQAAAATSLRTRSLDAFDAAVDSGVSANLCEALVDIARSHENTRELGISISWAPSRPVAEERDGTRLIFRPDEIEIISEAARVFREAAPLEAVRVDGVVVNLHRDENLPVPGLVTLQALIDGRRLTIRAVLSSDDYQKAIDAHRLRGMLSFRADVEREGRGWQARNPEDVVVVVDEQRR